MYVQINCILHWACTGGKNQNIPFPQTDSDLFLIQIFVIFQKLFIFW